MGNPREANYRLARYNGEYMIEVLDKQIGHWYVTACHIGSFEESVKHCEAYEGKTLKTILTEGDIERILDISDSIPMSKLETMTAKQYYEEILKRFYDDGRGKKND